jgi:hypothetical protein
MREVDLSPEEIIAYSTALAGAISGPILWIEKRFRDTKREIDQAVCAMRKERDRVITDHRSQHDAALRSSTIEHREATARLEHQAAALQRELAQLRVDNAKEMRDYPTKSELQSMFESVYERFDKIDGRMDGLLSRRNQR